MGKRNWSARAKARNGIVMGNLVWIEICDDSKYCFAIYIYICKKWEILNHLIEFGHMIMTDAFGCNLMYFDFFGEGVTCYNIVRFT